MARGANYKVSKRRRSEGKTNYHKRYEMIKNKKIRAVIRKTNKYIIVQFVYPTPIGDYTITSAHSYELVKLFGWKAGTKNTPAAYLTGLLAGLRAKKLGIDHAIPDIGLHRPVKGSKMFATIKGIKDAGVMINCSEEVLPSEDRITGKVIADYAKMLSETSPEKFQRQFSTILRNGLDPRELITHFEVVRNKIIYIYNHVQESSIAKDLIKQLTIGVRL